MDSGLLESYDMGDRGREAAPVGGLFFQMLAAKSCERVELCAAVVFAGLPLGGDPAFLLEFVQGRVERAVADLENVAGDLFQAKADGPAVHGLQGEDFQEKQIQSALNEVGRFAHALSSVTESTVHQLPSVSKGEIREESAQRAVSSE